MNIYKLEGYGNYAGGMAIVAANSPAEAVDLGNKLSSRPWNVEYLPENAEELAEIVTFLEAPKVLAHFEFGE